MTGTYQPRGRVYARYGTADGTLGPGVLTDAIIGLPGILSYPGQFDDIAERDGVPSTPFFASNLDADAPSLMDRRRARFSDADPGHAPDAGEALASGALTDAMMRQPGILSHPGPFDDLVDRNDGPPNFIFLPNLDAGTPAFRDMKRSTFSVVDPDPGPRSLNTPDTHEALSSGAPAEAPRVYPGILSAQVPPDEATGEQPVVLGPILVTDIDAEKPAFTDESGAGASDAKSNAGLVPGTVPGAGEWLGPGILTAPSRSGDSPYQGPRGDAEKQEAVPPEALFAWPEIGKIGHADGLESLIPFWGAGRNALADLQEGNYASAAINAGLLASDFFLWGAPAKFIFKAGQFGFKKSGIKGALEGSKYAIKGPGRITAKDKWRSARDKMKRRGMVVDGQEGHHIIPQAGWGKRGWGRNLPDAIKHHPLNIMWLPRDVHQRLHRNWMELPEFTTRQKIWHGTPRWSKALAGEVAGRGVAPVVEMTEDWAKK